MAAGHFYIRIVTCSANWVIIVGALSIRTILLKHHRLDGERLGSIAFSTMEDLQLCLLAFGLLEDTLVAVGLSIGATDRLVDQRADSLTAHSICIKIILPRALPGEERERRERVVTRAGCCCEGEVEGDDNNEGRRPSSPSCHD